MFSCPAPQHPLYHHLIGKGFAGHLSPEARSPSCEGSKAEAGTTTRPEKRAGRLGRVFLSMEGPLVSILRFSKRSPSPLSQKVKKQALTVECDSSQRSFPEDFIFFSQLSVTPWISRVSKHELPRLTKLILYIHGFCAFEQISFQKHNTCSLLLN